jgi:hypothetical protein
MKVLRGVEHIADDAKGEGADAALLKAFAAGVGEKGI